MIVGLGVGIRVGLLVVIIFAEDVGVAVEDLEPVLAILFISPALGVKVGVGSRLPGNDLTRIGWGEGREAACVGVGILSEGVGFSMIFTGVGIFGAFGDKVVCNRVSDEAKEAF